MKALITGIGGFVGSHLADLLTLEGWEVFGLELPEVDLHRLSDIIHKITVIRCDLTERQKTEQALLQVEPDCIFHLAAQSQVFGSFSDASHTIKTNIFGALNLLEAARPFKEKARILLVGSSEEYGIRSPTSGPITEDYPLKPISPYGVSKASQEMLGYQYAVSQGYDVVLMRPFNHTGPRHSAHFVCSEWAKHIALIEAGREEPLINHGNLDVHRDFSDVRDIVRGYYLAIKKCSSAEAYNICSGKAYRIRWILERLLSMADVPIEARVDDAKFRPADLPYLVGDNAKFRQCTGWEQTIPFEQTLSDILEYWRDQLVED